VIPRHPEVSALAASAENGGAWYRASDDGLLIELAAAPFGDWTVYQVVFSEVGDRHANFVFDVSGGEGLSPASSSPWDGWVAWSGPEVVVAYRNSDIGAQGAEVIPDGSPFTDSDDDEGPTEQEWALLARTITLTLMR